MPAKTNEIPFPIFQRRWGRKNNFYFTKTEAGWSIRFMSGPVETDPNGLIGQESETGIYDMLDREALSYPADLGDHLEWVWKHATEAQLSDALKVIADWVSSCEESSPQGGVFKGLKPSYLDQ